MARMLPIKLIETLMIVRSENNHHPWMQTRTAVVVFFVGFVVLWGAVSLLFYLEVP
jgi:hypothetical protein